MFSKTQNLLHIPKQLRNYATRTKIQVQKPIVEIDGDEMTRVIFDCIKKKLIFPFVEVERDYFDCSLTNRNNTENQVSKNAAAAILKHNVGIKCSTITPDREHIKEYNLTSLWPSPNGLLRNALNGTQFRESVICKNVNKYVPGWKEPIVMARHPFGDQYGGTNIFVPSGNKLSIRLESPDSEKNIDVFSFKGNGVAMMTFNTEDSIRAFATSCFRMALERKYPLYFASKNTLLKEYDKLFNDVFQDVYDKQYKKKFEEAGLSFEIRLIDDMAAQAMKSKGGFVWALKSYDGDVLSDVVGQGFGSMGLMIHSIISHDGKTVLTEPAHGTVTRHYRKYQKGKKVSTNPISSIFAWSRGLRHRALLDSHDELMNFTKSLETSTISTVEKGWYTKDLAPCIKGEDFSDSDYLSTHEFIDAVAAHLIENK
ncbi:cytosolic isocitrate dehydrogenase [NADP]-like [Coccinella septempunctata]|uniref:cytosolic isocitrate dehydrogenase [NADP]-like n=1 Tax=Coccinella septempunctata TaxID=41139 RepID=UPI001D08E9E4|nr:cytosolic isocitrate dehydrogenase [NADP]-like [Coccinella septempunctata]